MDKQNLLGLLISYGYAMSLLIISEFLHRVFKIKQSITRKIVHISAGMWVFGILILFNSWQIGIIPFASFIMVNYLLYKYPLIHSLDRKNSSPGTVYFAISITILFALFWRPNEPTDQVTIALAGVMSMTWGDALAALIGEKFGQHKYQVGTSVRSWEGSAVMFFVTTMVIFLILLLIPGSLFSPLATPIDGWRAMLAAVISATFATLLEGISPRGTDNLSVPLITAIVVWLIIGR
ncbi:diacylglycerol/polyprenol kinase family protein [Cylindrospermopsis curvispora]|uniref:Phosphatidate cytidylyltransferase n=2 Tax=Cylindrospermopsis TaxID=77021 RepID=A0A7H0F195_9CYAN|nr:phosphatidate cytidylyltransferase [Cylindrospermopsis curvispora]QNP29811.1 phosphatidate cytidylyltransferase [Cylindrospermopsis curvispora GIHE-G1]